MDPFPKLLGSSKASRQAIKAIAVLIVMVVGLVISALRRGSDAPSSAPPPPMRTETPSRTHDVPTNAPAASASPSLSNDGLLKAIDRKLEKALVSGSGVVEKVLPDDTEGDRHQRLIVRLDTTRTPAPTILIAHNIDVAERLNARPGDPITFKGEFIYNDRGGVIHWTHHDPRRSHPDGYLSVAGKRSE